MITESCLLFLKLAISALGGNPPAQDPSQKPSRILRHRQWESGWNPVEIQNREILEKCYRVGIGTLSYGVVMDRLNTLKEMAELLNVSQKTIYYWVARKEIPFLKVGRHLRFESAAVLNYFATNSRDAGLDGRAKAGSIQPLRSRSLKTGPGSLANSNKE